MTETPLPAYADTRKVFNQEAELSGVVPLERLPRFRENLISDEATIEAEIRFQRDSSGQRLITGELQARVFVQCQRCLEPVQLAMEDSINLALIEDEAQAASLRPELDPWLCESYKLDLARLLEEQLLLCLPIVSYHPAGQCMQAGYERGKIEDAQDEAEENPFSVLKTLKDSDKSD